MSWCVEELNADEHDLHSPPSKIAGIERAVEKSSGSKELLRNRRGELETRECEPRNGDEGNWNGTRPVSGYWTCRRRVGGVPTMDTAGRAERSKDGQSK